MEKKIWGKGEASEKDVWLYSTGNFSNNLIFMMIMMYIMYYYTNILGLPAIVAGMVFMVARLVDAITDPLMGMIVDRTNTKRMGKYRPFIIFGAPFLGVAFVLLFTTPNISMPGKIIYAYITYIFYSLTWTVVQIPQLTLPIMLSNNIARRTRIQAVFQGIGAVAVMVVQSWALPMLNFFGGVDNASAWSKVVIIYAIVATLIFIYSAQSVKKLDVYNPHAGKENAGRRNMSIIQSLKSVFTNRLLLCVILAYGTDMFATQIGNSMRIYFFKYNMGGRLDLLVYLGYVGLVAALVMILFIQPFIKRLGKRFGITIIESISILSSIVLLVAAPQKNIVLVMLSFVATTFLFNITNLLSRAAILDAANYSEMKTGIANNALISSTFTFINKVCQAISAFFAGYILSITGYNAAAAEQSPATLQAILYLLTIVPIVAYIFSLIGMYFYPLTRQGELDMEAKITEMHTAKMN
jgi:sugar (glycoside-pentoside-hexuronide) transporter